MNMTRAMRFLSAMAAALLVASTVSGPAGAQSSSPSPVPSPSADPLPWPTVPPQPAEPPLVPFEPTGPPDARTVEHGVVLELWVSPAVVGQGEWAQALVRVTNTRDDAVWTPGGECWLSTTVTADLTALDPRTAELTGNAAVFARRVIRERGLWTTGFRPWKIARLADGSGTVVSRLADCAPELGARFLRIPPGGSRERRFTWYPIAYQDALDTWWRPLPPGPVRVTASWEYAGHGARPSGQLFTRHPDLISASADLTLSGTDPAFPTPVELVEAALTDPTFAAWVDADPTREDWTGTYFGAWPGPGYPPQQRYTGLSGRAPNGIVEVALVRDLPHHPDTMGSALLDAATGEVLGFGLDCANEVCPAGWEHDPRRPAPSPAPSPSPMP